MNESEAIDAWITMTILIFLFISIGYIINSVVILIIIGIMSAVSVGFALKWEADSDANDI